MDENYDVDFIEDDSQLENDEDLGDASLQDFSSAVVSASDWTTETIITQIDKKNIQLDPKFQRRDAWGAQRKSKFIESLILGFPIPQIVLAENKEKKGSFIVLDGKQRLLSIRQFAAKKNDDVYKSLKLNSLEIRGDLNGKNLESLQNDPMLDEELSSFENQTIRTIVIRNWPNEAFLYHVFLRLNTGSVPLSPQELRQALHPGKFIDFLDEKSTESNALKDILNLKKADFRMRDNELMLRFIAYGNFFTNYNGNLKQFLDNCCLSFNKDWDRKENILNDQIEQFELAHQRLKEIFKGNLYRKWSKVNYEKRFNRAIFDILIHSFVDQEVRDMTQGKENLVEDLFKSLCSNDAAFLDSIESTTKSLNAVVKRFTAWNNALNENFGTNLPEYEVVESKINRVK